MAVKAKAEITISTIRDILSVVRFYKMLPKASGFPPVPTSPNPSGWTTSEPGYTAGSTNVLYLVDLTTFTDGTWKFSPVSKSSSYEAAKIAYETAVEASKTATDYISFVDGEGLIIGASNADGSLNKNILLSSTGIGMRDGKTLISSFIRLPESLDINMTTSGVDTTTGNQLSGASYVTDRKLSAFDYSSHGGTDGYSMNLRRIYRYLDSNGAQQTLMKDAQVMTGLYMDNGCPNACVEMHGNTISIAAQGDPSYPQGLLGLYSDSDIVMRAGNEIDLGIQNKTSSLVISNNGNVNIKKPTTISSTLNVTGAATFSGNVQAATFNGLNLANELNSKINKVNVGQTSSTILSYINSSGSAFGSMGFANVSDAPTSNREYAVSWFGSTARITVMAKLYNADAIVYYRDIWNGNWLQGSWYRALVADSQGGVNFPGVNGYSEHGITGCVLRTNGASLYHLTNNDGKAFIHVGQGIFSQRNSGGYAPVWASVFAQSSSKWIKKNIKDMDENTARKILELRPINYNYTNSDAIRYGLVAEEVMKIIPECVTVPDDYDEDTFKPTGDFMEDSVNAPSIGYADFVPFLIKMVQIQQKEIEDLKSKIKNL